MTTDAVAFVSRKEAASLLACSIATLRRYRKAGRVRWRWHANGRWREYVREDCARQRETVFRGDTASQ